MQKAYVCFDLGGTSIKTGVITKEGEMLAKSSIPTGNDFEECMEHMITYLEEQKTVYDVSGVAISAPGAVDSETGIIGGHSALEFVHGPNWKEEWKKRTGYDIAIENDANCAALSELHFGEAKDTQNFAYIVIGTGIGGAVVTDRVLRKGTNLHGGEFGYMYLPVAGESELKTWSWVGSSVATVRQYNEKHPEAPKTGEEIFELADAGDADAIEAVKAFYRYNAMGIYNVQFVTDPELILIGGGISRRADFMEQLNEAIAYIFSQSEARPRPTVKVGKFLDDANLYGALANLLYV